MRSRFLLAALLAALLVPVGTLLAPQALAQSTVRLCTDNGASGCTPVSSTSPLPTSAAATTTAACTGVIPINQTASTDVHTFTLTGYICSIVLVSAAQQGISISEGTGATCGTGTAFLVGGAGGTTQVAANGGFSAVAASPWLKLGTAADHLCVIQSGIGNVSGVITYADH